jgi:hypothetical protein
MKKTFMKLLATSSVRLKSWLASSWEWLDGLSKRMDMTDCPLCGSTEGQELLSFDGDVKGCRCHNPGCKAEYLTPVASGFSLWFY